MESRNKEINSSDEVIIEESIVLEIENEAAAEESSAASSDIDNSESNTQKTSFFKCELFTPAFRGLSYTFLGSVAVYLLSRFVPIFAEYWTRYPAQWIRFLLAKITGWIPFSFAEAVIVCLPILSIAFIVASSYSTKRDDSDANFFKWIRPLISLLLVILMLFCGAFGPAYGRYKLADNLSLEQSDVSSDELFTTAIKVANLAKNDLDQISFDLTGESIIPFDYGTLVEKMNIAFEKYADDVDFISHFSSNPKAIALSKPMTYTHISGVYTFMTGESNINTNYPDFLMPYTMAHEMAHQRGIAREDEANFVAYLVCIGSDDPYIRYSGYANMLNYLTTPLASASMERYRDFVINYMPIEISYEFSAYSQFFDKYRDSVASEVTGTVNNTFLQSQGQDAGTKSYGLVVDLAVAYYK